MPDQLITQRVLVRDMPDRSRIIATLRVLQFGRGNAQPYFSATAEIYEAHGTHSGASRNRRGLEPDSGGCQHGAILTAFPGAAAFVRMHLSDHPSGEPMHAIANGWYYLSRKHADDNAKDGYWWQRYWWQRYWWQRTGLEALANLWRLDDVRGLPHEVIRAWQAGGVDHDDRDSDAWAAFHAFYEQQQPRWAAEARAAVELLELMPDVTQLRGYDMHGEPIDRQPLPAWLIGADPELVNV